MPTSWLTCPSVIMLKINPSAVICAATQPKFTNLSPDSDTDYLSDGIADGILTDLSGIARLGVVSSTSAMM